jgi:hypothetical protein
MRAAQSAAQRRHRARCERRCTCCRASLRPPANSKRQRPAVRWPPRGNTSRKGLFPSRVPPPVPVGDAG